MTDSHSNILQKGSLLIASPHMVDPFFNKSVIVICEHSHVGCFGLMLTKRFELDLPEELSELKESQNPHVELKIGGPVQPTQLMLLHTDCSVSHTLEIIPSVFLGGDLEFLQNTLQDPQGPFVALCFGYSGWGPGELEQDISGGLWIVSKAKREDIFLKNPEELWKKVLES